METKDGNKLIAEFMELPFNGIMYWRQEILGYDAGANLGYDVLGLLYHEDWNWLMQVAEKIEKKTKVMEIHKNFCALHGELPIGRGKNTLEAVWNAVLIYIQWHNDKKATLTP